MNEQPIEKRSLDADGYLSVHSVFRTIQGEGPNAGRPATFVRLAGCNLMCAYCDTEYTQGRRTYSPVELREEVWRKQALGGLVVITGGEPFRQNIRPFVEYLYADDSLVQIETNGTLPPPRFDSAEWPQIVCSPKTEKVHPEIVEHCTAWKYVVDATSIHPNDGLPLQALGHPCRHHVRRPPPNFPRHRIYVQPADRPDVPGANDANLTAAMNSCMRFGYTLCLQLHKAIGLP